MFGRWAVGIIACALFAAGCGDDGSDEASESFASPEYGYSLELPTGWSALAAEHDLEPGEPPTLSSKGTDVLAAQPSRMITDLTKPAIVVGAQPVEPGTTLDDWTAEVTEIVGGFKGCAQPAAVEEIDVASEPATLLEYPDCPDGLGLDHLWVAFVRDDRGIQFVWFDESSSGPVERDQFEQILSTVAFDE